MTEHRLEKPITVETLVTERRPAWREKLLFGGKCGDMVSIRPVGEKYEGRTFLGVLIGEIAQGVSIGIRPDGALLYDMAHHNPAIFVPDLDTVIFGNASWWGVIRSADQLRQITDADIDNVWYVRALRQLARDEAEQASGDEPPDEGEKA